MIVLLNILHIVSIFFFLLCVRISASFFIHWSSEQQQNTGWEWESAVWVAEFLATQNSLCNDYTMLTYVLQCFNPFIIRQKNCKLDDHKPKRNGKCVCLYLFFCFRKFTDTQYSAGGSKSLWQSSVVFEGMNRLCLPHLMSSQHSTLIQQI